MVDPLDVVVDRSLGQLAAALGIIDEAARARLGQDLLARARAGKATSMARLLLQAGLTTPKLQELFLFGARFPAVRCDACELSIPQARFPSRQETPCPRCGSLVVGFSAYAGRSAAEEETKKEGPPPAGPEAMLADTERWRAVLPLPGQPARDSGQTDRWPGVLPVPTSKAPPVIRPPSLESSEDLTADGDSDIGGRTMTFGHVLPAPQGTVKLFPEDARGATDPTVRFDASLPTPRAPLPPGAPSEPGAELTIGFGEVYLLPGSAAPRSEAEVTSELHTLLATPPATPPPGFEGPAGFARSQDAAPLAFDPAGVTAPMRREDVDAALALGPPTPPADPSPPPPGKGKKVGTVKKKRPEGRPASGGKKKVALVVVVLLLIGGIAALAAWRLGLLG